MGGAHKQGRCEGMANRQEEDNGSNKIEWFSLNPSAQGVKK
jgi:hypothetical protein